MAYKPTCLVCQKEMVRGFMTDDKGDDGVNLPFWIPGEPSDTTWKLGTVPRSQVERTGIEIVAYRCPECHALRLYAPSGS